MQYFRRSIGVLYSFILFFLREKNVFISSLPKALILFVFSIVHCWSILFSSLLSHSSWLLPESTNFEVIPFSQNIFERAFLHSFISGDHTSSTSYIIWHLILNTPFSLLTLFIYFFLILSISLISSIYTFS